MRDLLSRLIDDFHERPLPDLLPREKGATQVEGKANAIVGMRRVGKRKAEAIQVCWSMAEPAASRRELGALESAQNELGIESGTVVTWLDEDSSQTCNIVPVWKWLLEERGGTT